MSKPSPWSNSRERPRKHECVLAGVALARENMAWKNATPILYQDNISARPEALIIPHSELAMHLDAAGKEIIALFTTPNAAFVVYEDGEGCQFTHGSIHELLTPELATFMERFPRV